MSNPFENQIKSIREQLIRIQGKKIGAFAKESKLEQSRLMQTEAGFMAQLAATEARAQQWEESQERQKADQERRKAQQEAQQKKQEAQDEARKAQDEARKEAQGEAREAQQKAAQMRVSSKSR